MKEHSLKIVDEVKGIIEGLAIPFGGPLGGKDLEGEFFDKDTDLALDWFPEDGRPVLYDHGLDGAVKLSVIGRQISHHIDPDVGVWMQAQLNQAHRYTGAVLQLIAEGAMGLSSGSVSHLMSVEKSGKITRWPWIEESLTPTPSNPYAMLPADAVKHFEPLGLEPPEPLLSAVKVWEETENEIRHSVRDADRFQDGSFRRITLKEAKPRVFAVIGRLKGETSTIIQSLRFPKDDTWTVAKAKQWVADHPDAAKSDEIIRDLEATFNIHLTYDEQATETEHALASVKVFVGRSRSLADLRAEEGRGFSAANRDRLSRFLADVKGIGDEIDALLRETVPDAERLLALKVENERIIARLQGVPIPQ